MFDALLKSKFYSKCKSDIKLTKMRIEIIKRKRKAMQKFMRKDVADLLTNGLDSHAYGRVDGLYVEQNLTWCYEFVEQSVSFISSHLSTMNKQRECPQECREAIATSIFAAARFADLPELRKLRTLFTEKYGNFLEPFVNKEFVRKLKSEPPNKEMKLQIMQESALESGIEWDSKALEQKLYQPPQSAQDQPQYTKEDPRNKKSPKNQLHQNGLGTHIQETYSRHGNNHKEVEKKKDEYKSNAEIGKKADERHRNEGVLPYRSRNTSVPSENTRIPGPVDAASGAVAEERKVFGFKSMAPPYIKTDNGKRETSPDTTTPSSSGTEEESSNKTEPVPRSVRRRPSKEVSKAVPKPSNAEIRDHEEEERRMEDLLSHYSGKETPDVKKKSSGAAPTRVGSLPTEPSPTPARKGHARTASYQSDSTTSPPLGHVHPKLPDYDEFVAR